MNKKVLVSSFPLLAALVSILVTGNAWASAEEVVASFVVQNNLHSEGVAHVRKTTLPSPLTGQGWDLIAKICLAQGDDLSPWAGQQVEDHRSPLTEVYRHPMTRAGFHDEPLDLHLLMSGEKKICGYLSVRADSLAAPGVYGLYDANVRRPKQ